MIELSISDISKRPSILDNLDDIAKIVNKKTDEVKGIFISAKDLPYIKELLEELEYQKWYRKNGAGLETSQKDFSGLLDNAIDELGDKL